MGYDYPVIPQVIFENHYLESDMYNNIFVANYDFK